MEALQLRDIRQTTSYPRLSTESSAYNTLGKYEWALYKPKSHHSSYQRLSPHGYLIQIDIDQDDIVPPHLIAACGVLRKSTPRMFLIIYSDPIHVCLSDFDTQSLRLRCRVIFVRGASEVD